jgi:hypothetical protein
MSGPASSPTPAKDSAALLDADDAARWLAAQPQANALVMLSGLLAQVESLNAGRVAPRERFKILEVLRQAVYAVGDEGQRRYAFRALPLLPAEQLVFDQARRLWRACAQGYLHSLDASLESDPALVDRRALALHRALSCLRQEQLNCYVAGAELAADFWSVLHSLWAAAEALGVTRCPFADPLQRETRESTLSGHYAMALLLHLARPYSLSRAQLAAAIRWFSRWREQAKVLRAPETGALALDLATAAPTHDDDDAQRAAGTPRWLVIDRVLRKMRERLELLASGQSPETLKLGSGLPPAECAALLATLGDRLTHPLADETASASESIIVAAGLGNACRLLGGAIPKDEAATSSFASQLVVEQIAVFGHVVRASEARGDDAAELWRLASCGDDELRLTRGAAGGERLTLKSLLVARLPPSGLPALATISSLCWRRDGSLQISACRLSGTPTPLLVEAHEKLSGRILRHPAILLSAGDDNAAPQVLLPAGLAGRASAIRFFDGQARPLPPLVLTDCVAHGADNERWRVSGQAAGGSGSE